MAKTYYSPAAKVYATVVALIGFSVFAWAFLRYPLSADQWLYVSVLGLLSIILNSIGATLPNTTSYVSLESMGFYAAALSLNPLAAAIIAAVPIFRWYATTAAATRWGLFRNLGHNALMGIGAALTYALAGGDVPLQHLTVRNVVALGVAVVGVRIINDGIVFGVALAAHGLRQARREFMEHQAVLWAVEVVVYVPALLTALLYGHKEWAALAVWLGVLVVAAFTLYQLVRTRVEAKRRLLELQTLNAQMIAYEAREATLARRLSQAADDMTGYAGRMVGALHTQHIAMTQVTATVEELAQQAGYIAEAASAVDSTSELALATAGRGRQAAAGSVQAMADLERNVQEMQTRMNALEGRSRLIYRTLQTINSIAGETHLLALNATIEAAGAGEQGRRFNLVATQINALADQALRAAGEIQSTVRDIETATTETRQVIEQGLVETRRYTGQVDEARQAMEGILGAVGRARGMAQQIRLATEQQTQASSQVSDAMREIAASLGSAGSEGAAVSSAADVLRQLAERLRQLDERMPVGRSVG